MKLFVVVIDDGDQTEYTYAIKATSEKAAKQKAEYKAGLTGEIKSVEEVKFDTNNVALINVEFGADFSLSFR